MLASHYDAGMSQFDSLSDRFTKEPGTVLSVEITADSRGFAGCMLGLGGQPLFVLQVWGLTVTNIL